MKITIDTYPTGCIDITCDGTRHTWCFSELGKALEFIRHKLYTNELEKEIDKIRERDKVNEQKLYNIIQGNSPVIEKISYRASNLYLMVTLDGHKPVYWGDILNFHELNPIAYEDLNPIQAEKLIRAYYNFTKKQLDNTEPSK